MPEAPYYVPNKREIRDNETYIVGVSNDKSQVPYLSEDLDFYLEEGYFFIFDRWVAVSSRDLPKNIEYKNLEVFKGYYDDVFYATGYESVSADEPSYKIMKGFICNMNYPLHLKPMPDEAQKELDMMMVLYKLGDI